MPMAIVCALFGIGRIGFSVWTTARVGRCCCVMTASIWWPSTISRFSRLNGRLSKPSSVIATTPISVWSRRPMLLATASVTTTTISTSSCSANSRAARVSSGSGNALAKLPVASGTGRRSRRWTRVMPGMTTAVSSCITSMAPKKPTSTTTARGWCERSRPTAANTSRPTTVRAVWSPSRIP
ncbi:hypothetical protein PS876_05250 [Pseudomonas fluorescens]|nr:hypothetical protein PS876_05250 [Pseudomonas fluorescens]